MIAQDPRLLSFFPRLWWRALSVPILLKILGIGGVVAILFGTVVLIQIRFGVARSLYPMLEAQTCSRASAIAVDIEHALVTGETMAVREHLRREMASLSEIRYIVVRDASGSVVAHTFPGSLPRDLESLRGGDRAGRTGVVVLSTPEGLVFHTSAPILKGRFGQVELGVSDREIVAAQQAMTRSTLLALALAAVLGIGLATILAHVISRPVVRLTRAADAIGEGDYSMRARATSGDEIGHLAEAFNRMAERLEDYRGQVTEKQRTQRLLIEKIIQTQEDERRAISRELHDQIGQSLLVLHQRVQPTGAGRTPEGGAAELCASVESQVSGMIEEVRRLAWRMRPPILDDLGLDSALSRHVQEVEQQSGFHVEYQYTATSGLGRLPEGIEVTLYRIAQEALANVQRHAQASRASVVLLHERQGATLLIEDDGCGFDVEAPSRNGRHHLGLVGMRERVGLLGGSFSCESVVGKGTTVRVRVPLVG